MNKQTILSAYAKAHEQIQAKLSYVEALRRGGGFSEKTQLFWGNFETRRARQMEALAARLAVVGPTKRNALSDDTPLSAEAMMKLGAQKMGGRFVVYSEWWFCERNFIWDGTNLKIGTANGEVTADGVRTVGDLKALYRMLTDRELEVMK